MAAPTYPPTPHIQDPNALLPSEAFRQQVRRVILGIITFIVIYILIVLLGIAMLIGLGAAGIGLISLYTTWITLAIGAGLIGTGVMFFVFTIKFIFSTSSDVPVTQIQVYRRDQPELFAFIERLSKEVGTRFPGKIFLTPEVNAAVLYNSSFWSMFLPVRKNLRIGLGLVNSLNLSEFKATMAHEFGHFSQKSMKAGSYVYTMNKVIFNLTFHRDRFDNLLERWSDTGGVFGFFASLTSWFINLLRGVLEWCYRRLNLSYMALSRQMEYHADLVATSVAGGGSMVSALRRSEFGAHCYDASLSNLARLGSQNRRVEDVYAYHTSMMKSMAGFGKMNLVHGLPDITSEALTRNIVQSRLHVEDQWASHPTREEREASIAQLDAACDVSHESAWSVFANVESLRAEMTLLLYEPASQPIEFLRSAAEIDEEVRKSLTYVSIPATFRGVYNSRWISSFDVEKASANELERSFEQVFLSSSHAAAGNLARDRTDLDTLIAIQGKRIPCDFFEYDGQRYSAKDARKLVEQLDREIQKAEADIKDLDVQIYSYYYQQAKRAGTADEFRKLYVDAMALLGNLSVCQHFQSRLASIHASFNRREWRDDHVTALLRSIGELESQVKEFMLKLPQDWIDNYFLEPENVKTYLRGKHLWNNSIIEFNQEGYQQLTAYVSCCLQACTEEVHRHTGAIYSAQLKLTPPEYLIAD